MSRTELEVYALKRKWCQLIGMSTGADGKRVGHYITIFPYCPVCEIDHNIGDKFCPDCGAELVHHYIKGVKKGDLEK